ncbi:MAG: hypothetical protein DRN54_03850 [Thaumarchaeota archaeon]|nr:MAG: hypothetical protein DRN54_03850 [Nitrososphaerota archaeon]
MLKRRLWAGGPSRPRLVDRAGFEPYRSAPSWGLARDLPHAKRAISQLIYRPQILSIYWVGLKFFMRYAAARLC